MRDLSLPLIGAEDPPPTPSGGGTSLIVGGSSEDEAPFVLSDGLPAIPAKLVRKIQKGGYVGGHGGAALRQHGTRLARGGGSQTF